MTVARCGWLEWCCCGTRQAGMGGMRWMEGTGAACAACRLTTAQPPSMRCMRAEGGHKNCHHRPGATALPPPTHTRTWGAYNNEQCSRAGATAVYTWGEVNTTDGLERLCHSHTHAHTWAAPNITIVLQRLRCVHGGITNINLSRTQPQMPCRAALDDAQAQLC